MRAENKESGRGSQIGQDQDKKTEHMTGREKKLNPRHPKNYSLNKSKLSKVVQIKC